MGGATGGVKTAGGGPATGLADEFIRYLSQGLTSGNFGGITPYGGTAFQSAYGDRSRPRGGRPTGVPGGQTTPADAFNATSPYGQAGSFSDAINRMLSGSPGGAFNPAGGYAALPGLDVADNPYNDLLQREKASDVAATRERFTATGGGTTFGTPAAYAEAVTRSEANARNAATLADIDRMMRGLSLESFRLGETGREFDLSQMGDIVRSLLATYTGISGLGIPQAATYYKPGWLENLAGIAKGGASIYSQVKGA